MAVLIAIEDASKAGVIEVLPGPSRVSDVSAIAPASTIGVISGISGIRWVAGRVSVVSTI